MVLKVSFDGTLELDGGAVSAATDLPLCERGKEALDLIDPGSRGRSEVHVEARMAGEPTTHSGGLVRAVVVHHQVHVELVSNVRLDGVQELQELAAAMAPMQLADDFAGCDIERGKQRGRAVTLIVVRTPLGQARHHRQHGLRAIQRLDLTLLINAQYQRFGRRIEVKTDDIPDFLDKQRISGELEGLGAMRLQSKGMPDAHHGSLRQAAGFSHQAATPMRRALGPLVQRLGNHRLNLPVPDASRRSGTRLIEQTVEPQRKKPCAPFAHSLTRDAQLMRHRAVRVTLGGCQHNARAQRQGLRALVPTRSTRAAVRAPSPSTSTPAVLAHVASLAP